jgi:hypothetical protein
MRRVVIAERAGESASADLLVNSVMEGIFDLGKVVRMEMRERGRRLDLSCFAIWGNLRRSYIIIRRNTEGKMVKSKKKRKKERKTKLDKDGHSDNVPG